MRQRRQDQAGAFGHTDPPGVEGAFPGIDRIGRGKDQHRAPEHALEGPEPARIHARDRVVLPQHGGANRVIASGFRLFGGRRRAVLVQQQEKARMRDEDPIVLEHHLEDVNAGLDPVEPVRPHRRDQKGREARHRG